MITHICKSDGHYSRSKSPADPSPICPNASGFSSRSASMYFSSGSTFSRTAGCQHQGGGSARGSKECQRGVRGAQQVCLMKGVQEGVDS